MQLVIHIFFSLLLWHYSSGNQISTTQYIDEHNQDEVELFRQLFMRLNLIIKDNTEMKANMQELREEIKQLRYNSGSAQQPIPVPIPPTVSISPNCYNKNNRSNTNDFDDVYCFGNNWLIVQRRINGSENFDRTWEEYKNGFGNSSQEFFLGLEKLYVMTLLKPHELVIILKDFNNDVRYARYDNFQLTNEQNNYMLKELGQYSGNAGDSLRYHLNGKFSTIDRDNDENFNINCAQKFGGGWWYRNCHESNLNGHYIHTDHHLSYASGIHWKTFRNKWYSLKYSQMMIRPKN